MSASARSWPASTSMTSPSSPSTGARIRQWILATPFPPAFEQAVRAQLRQMSGGAEIAVAVRSSATAEDLPEASFAGQQETFLNVRGEAGVLRAMHEVFASLFNDRAISYRVHQGFDHSAVALSAGVQHMVRSDLGAARRDVHARHRIGLPRRGVHHRLLGPGRDGGAGRGQPGRVLRLQAGAARRQAAVLRRNLGGKAIKMVYAPEGSAARVQTVEVPAGRARSASA